MGYFSDLAIRTNDQQCASVTATEALQPNADHGRNIPAAVSQADQPITAVKAECDPATDEKNEPVEQTEAEKKKAHEEAEAKRKAEWEAKKKARDEEEQIAWEKAVSMDDDALLASSVKRLGDATERLTRRNMKLCVTEYVQTMCYEDLAFARQTMHPRKNMLNCFHFINRKAREYLEQEMKDNDEKPQGGGFGGDVPDELCYAWAVEYFNTFGLKEDKLDTDEEFVPKPYNGRTSSSKPKKTKTAPTEKKPTTSAKSKDEADKAQSQLTIF